MLHVHSDTEALLKRYLTHFPDEAPGLAALQRQLDTDPDVFHRFNMAGHVTSSAAVLNPAGDEILMIDHRFLRRWLTPGGHYEPPGSLLQSALREVAEETGVDGVLPHSWTVSTGAPLDVDTHQIPANRKKGEGPHVHHDFLFLSSASPQSQLQAQLAEVKAAKWLPLKHLAEMDSPRLQRIMGKLRELGITA